MFPMFVCDIDCVWNVLCVSRFGLFELDYSVYCGTTTLLCKHFIRVHCDMLRLECFCVYCLSACLSVCSCAFAPNYFVNKGWWLSLDCVLLWHSIERAAGGDGVQLLLWTGAGDKVDDRQGTDDNAVQAPEAASSSNDIVCGSHTTPNDCLAPWL